MSSNKKQHSSSTRRSLHVVIDSELDALINAAVTNDGVSTSAIVRDALRVYFKISDPRDRGWREGYAAGIASVQRRMREVLAGLEREPHGSSMSSPSIPQSNAR